MGRSWGIEGGWGRAGRWLRGPWIVVSGHLARWVAEIGDEDGLRWGGWGVLGLKGHLEGTWG